MKPSKELSKRTRNTVNAQRALEQQFELLLSSVIDYAFIIFDLENRVTAWNPGAERILGYKESEILGQPGSLFFTPEDREKGGPEHEIESARRTGRSEDERWHLRKDGSRFWASGILTLLCDESGQPRGFAKIMRDLTERRHAEQAMRESEERLRLFVENVRDRALFQVDAAGRVSLWNAGAENLFGYSDEEILGQHIGILFPREDRERGYPEQELAQALAEGKAEDGRWVVRRDGTRFFARWVTHPIFDDTAALRGFANILRDESEQLRVEEDRKRLEQQERARLEQQVEHAGAELDRSKDELRALAASLLRAQDEERRRIARELHDDLSQRLAVLEIELMRLQQGQNTPGPVRTNLERLRQHVSTLSEDVRTVSHRLHPSMLEDLGLEVALQALVEDFARVHGLSPQFESTLPRRPMPLSMATTLYRIAQEGLQNVAKHAAGASVKMGLAPTADGVVLRIRDDGPGFDPKAARTYGGLGLVSVKERARVAGGTVEVRSAPGDGTELWVVVPWPERE